MAGKQMQLEDWLDDLCVRFVINLPQEDLSSVARICFQVEEAQWFYEDFIRPLDPSLPSMSLRTFCLRIFKHCPLLASFPVEVHIQAFEEFLQYKTRVPVRGAIMLNPAMDSVVLVKGWKKGANWSFPRGKINKDEDDLDCAVREVYEETGLDLREAGLVPTEAKPKYIEISMREQQLRLYVIRDVPMDTKFQPRTRKEISKIDWYKLTDLPTLRKKGNQNQPQYDSSGPGPNANKFYMVAPFLVPLKKWIVSQKKGGDKRAVTGQHSLPVNHMPIEEEPTEDEAWTNDATTKAQTFESFDGATRELQRLLNVQPQAEAPPLENKASALLSLLQPSVTSSRPLEPQSQVPQDFNMAGTGQPQYSQHHHHHHHPNNMQHGHLDTRQPPPPSALPSNQQAGSGWDASQSHPQSQAPPPAYPGFANYAMANPHPGYHGGPQPAQQSSQAATTGFGGHAFQDGPSQASLPQAPAQNLSGMAHQALPFGLSSQLVPQAHLPAGSSRPVPLNGQALALLNAFKQGPAPPASSEPNKEGQGAQQPSASHDVDQQHPSPYSQYAAPHRIPSVHVGPKSPSELAGSAVTPARRDQHKSALLDLFKKQQPEAPADRIPIPGKQDGGKEVVQPPAPAEKELLAQLQSPAGLVSTGGQQRSNPAENLAVDRLSVRKSDKRSNNANNNKSAHGNSPVRNKASGKSPRTTRNAAKPTGPQPTRILQRGESLQSLEPEEPKSTPNIPAPPEISSAPQDSSSGAVASQHQQQQQRPRSTASPAVTTIPPFTQPPAPLGSQLNYQTQTQNYRPDVSQEQKRQLLSLFGAPQTIRREPSRAGSSTGETPMSPADQTFLLDYLQSVTNNAGR